MPILASIRFRLRALFARQRLEQDLDREMRFHLEMEAEHNRRAGLSSPEAERRAHIAFGGVERHREAVRDERGIRPLDDLVMDLRYGWRGLRRTPGFTIAAVVVLGLGIGAATAVSTTVNHVLRSALPYRDPSRLVFLTEATKTGEGMLTSFPSFDDWRQRTRSFDAMTAFMPVSQSRAVLDGRAVRARTQSVSREFFDVFGVPPMIGRAIRPDENAPGGTPVVVVSAEFWQSSLGAPRDLHDVNVQLDGRVYPVVGVMPYGFRVLEPADLWLPAEAHPVNIRGAGNYWVIGRLAAGVSLEAAHREMDAIAALLKREYGDAAISSAVFAEPLQMRVVGSARRPLLLLLGAGVFVLVVTCASVAMMQLARGASRQQEMSIRTTLGAGRFRLARQLVTEQLTLATLGCGAGMLVAWAAVVATRRYGVDVLPRVESLSVDPVALGIALAASAVAVVVFGTAPVARLLGPRRLSGAGSVRGAGTTRTRRGSALIAAQAAVTVLLVVGASLLVRSVYKVLTADLGYDRRGLLSANVQLVGGRYHALSERLATSLRIRDALAGIAGVDQVALTSQLPSQTGGNRGPILVPPFGDPLAQDSWKAIASLRVVTTDYFAVLRTPLLRGRMLNATDREGAKSVVINQSLAERLWPDQDPIGHRLRVLADIRNDTLTVVGVVREARHWQLDAGRQPELYVTIWQRPEDAWQMNAVMHVTGKPGPVIRAAYQRLRDIDPELAPVVRTLDAAMSESIADRRFMAGVLLLFAMVVLVLTVAGIAGSVAYNIQLRTRELGIRMAIGASRRTVWMLVQRDMLASAAVGGLLGLAAALPMTSLISSLLYGMTARDPLALAAALAISMLAVAGAAAVPALRAARIDPALAVRLE